jgi:hypothetical protein
VLPSYISDVALRHLIWITASMPSYFAFRVDSRDARVKPYPFLVPSRSHALATPLSSYNAASLASSYIGNAASLPTCGAMPHYHSCGILPLVQRSSERPKLSFRLYCSSLNSCGIGADLYCGIFAVFYIGCDVRSHYAARR